MDCYLDAYLDGYDDYFDGYDLSQTPYRHDLDLHYEWKKGWLAAEEDEYAYWY